MTLSQDPSIRDRGRRIGADGAWLTPARTEYRPGVMWVFVTAGRRAGIPGLSWQGSRRLDSGFWVQEGGGEGGLFLPHLFVW